MQKLKLTPVANAKKLNRNELKNIFGGDTYGSGKQGSGNRCGCDAPLCSIFGRVSKGARCGTTIVICC